VYAGQSAQDIVTYTKSFGGLSLPVTIQTAVRIGGRDNTLFSGICFTDGTATSSNAIMLSIGNVSANFRIASYSGTITNLVNGHIDTNDVEAAGQPMHLRLCAKSSNTWRLATSIDAVTWDSHGVGDVSFTMTPTNIGFCVSTYGQSGNGLARFDYLRFAEADLITGIAA
jgi:hypothetical protein